MSFQTNLSYCYDGTYYGFLSGVFESFRAKELPTDFFSEDSRQFSLYPVKWIQTDRKKANRVDVAVRTKLGNYCYELIRLGFLSCLVNKERSMLCFLHRAFRDGPKAANQIADDHVYRLTKAVRHLSNEAHLLKGFIRFSDIDGSLCAVITPKNHVLPVIANHFLDRYPNENFLIYDQTHREAFIYENRTISFLKNAAYMLPQSDETEAFYRKLWQNYYDTIAIEGRYNPRCRMTHMPKRYWENMTELGEGFRKKEQQKLKGDGVFPALAE